MPDSRIMVAVSSPWASDKLFDAVRDLASRLDAAIVVVHVAQPSEGDDTENEARQRGEQTLATLTEQLAEANVPTEGMLLFGDDVARALLNAAVDQSVSMIVLGLSGRGRVARLLAGDVPQAVIKNAEVPVLLFPPEWAGTI